MGCIDYLLPIIASIYKLSVYVYLRVIPYTSGTLVIPSLYIVYTSILVFGPKQLSHGSSRSKLSPASNTSLISFIGAVLVDLPSPSPSIRLLSLFLNTILLGFAIDFTTYPLRHPVHDLTFSRIGAIDHQSAKVLLRYPFQAQNNATVKVVFRPARHNQIEDPWIDGPFVYLNENADWTNYTILKNLWPNTKYEYRLASRGSGSDFLPYPPSALMFKTFPDPRLSSGTNFKFIATSCILPNFPYAPGRGDRIHGFDLLYNYIWPDASGSFNSTSEVLGTGIQDEPLSRSQSGSHVEFLLTMGDLIYADVPAYFGDSVEAYRRLYRQIYASPSFRKVYERLPSVHIYDDHEIINNFAGNSNGTTWPYYNASRAFGQYVADANFNSPDNGSFYFNFRYGDVAYFVMDTRKDRKDRSSMQSTSSKGTMLGEKQLKTFLGWLSEVNQTATFKFIVSSVPFTSLWQFDAQTDSWAAFVDEKNAILSALHTVPNVFILSGDRHEFAVIEYSSHSPQSHPVREISTSPLNMFYVPFVKTLAEESRERVPRVVGKTSKHANGSEIISYENTTIPAEKVLRYISHGNYKWSTFEIDTRNLSRPVLKLETVIDGYPAYRWKIEGEPVSMKRITALGSYVPQSFHSVINKLGFMPSKWF